jgi:type IV pilus assembly protein PilO
MHAAIEDFLSRPRSHIIGAWVGSFLLLILVYWQYSFRGQQKEYLQQEEKVEELTQKIADESRRARNLNKLKERIKQLDINLKIALQELPDKREIPDLLSSISNLARDAGLEVVLFKPGTENPQDFYAEVPVSVSVQGTFHQVATFFDEVGQLSRVVNINQISVRDPVITDESVQVKTDCVATTFRYLSESERQQLETKEEGGKKRRR